MRKFFKWFGVVLGRLLGRHLCQIEYFLPVRAVIILV